MQWIAQTAVLLGAGEAYGRLLAERYWANVYPTLPPDYRSPECRDGGGMDAKPKSGVWP